MKRLNSKNTPFQKVTLYITKYWFVLVLALILIPALIKRLKERKIQVDDKDFQSNKELDKIGVSETRRGALMKLTIDIAQGLGTSFSFFDPRHWSENDEEVYELLRNLNQSEFDIVKVLYKTVYAKGRDLGEDLGKYLDDKYYRLLTLV